MVDGTRDTTLVRSVKLFRPYADAVPWDLFDAFPGDVAPERLEELVKLAEREPQRAMLRVAKLNHAVLGAYLISRMQPVQFELDYLVVAPQVRHQGLGSWLLGHAIGLAEAKGGRSLAASGAALQRFLAAYGFERTADGSIFQFRPE